MAENARWRKDLRQQRPVLGRVVVALTPKPVIGRQSQATRAWGDGADGEEHVASVLARCEGVCAVHDCRVPGSRANIDHIAVGPSGIFVIDAKRYSGIVERRDVGGWLRRDERLYVAGRDRTKLVDGMARQVHTVKQAVEAHIHTAVSVAPVLCFVGADWPLLRRPPRIGDVLVVWPRALAQLVMTPGALTADDVARFAAVIAASLPGA